MTDKGREPLSTRAFLGTVAACIAIVSGVVTFLGTYVFQTQANAHQVKTISDKEMSDMKTSSAVQTASVESIKAAVESVQSEVKDTKKAMRRIYRRQHAADENMQRLLRRFKVAPYERSEDTPDLFGEDEEP